MLFYHKKGKITVVKLFKMNFITDCIKDLDLGIILCIWYWDLWCFSKVIFTWKYIKIFFLDF